MDQKEAYPKPEINSVGVFELCLCVKRVVQLKRRRQGFLRDLFLDAIILVIELICTIICFLFALLKTAHERIASTRQAYSRVSLAETRPCGVSS